MQEETDFKTIGEVSALLGVPQHVIRFWETHFPQLAPLKRKGGRRFYGQKDLDVLWQIKNLLYAKGYTIKGAKQELDQTLPVSRDESVMKKKTAPVKDSRQIDIFEVIAQPTAEEKGGLKKILETLKEMQKILEGK